MRKHLIYNLMTALGCIIMGIAVGAAITVVIAAVAIAAARIQQALRRNGDEVESHAGIGRGGRRRA